MTKVGLNFQSLPLHPDLIEVTRELGYTQMTEIQAEAIPLLLAGKDVIGQSKTGSGKTAAFSLPILNGFTLADIRRKEIKALILCPTRELCTQVAREMRRLGRKLPGLQTLILSGGHPLYPQLCALEKGAHIAVGTPGRVLDLLARKKLSLISVTTVVLDESDRMLDMGFKDDIERVLSEVPKPRQMVLFSATFPKTIEGISKRYQTDAVRITIESSDESLTPDIEQVIYQIKTQTEVNAQVPGEIQQDKFNALLDTLEHYQPESAIVFCNLKATVAGLAEKLEAQGVSVACIHGDLEQSDRDRVMAKFRNRSTRVLIATDVAARGLDIENLDIVVNFDLPAQTEVYVHRIGRTGRAGKKGVAVSLALARESRKLELIKSETDAQFKTVSGFNTRGLSSQKTNTISSKATLPEIVAKPLSIATAAMETLFISGGRKDKLRPGDILGALTGDAAQMSASAIGKIEIHDRFAYVAIDAAQAEFALTRLRDGRIKGRKFRVEKVR
jgi:ATP-independent RNA helicase DbpA